ncbi:ABC transporter permease [Bifidobacterium thermophilum]|uniref:ABC transporter permease n=1 Tax=Bifidobacterium thermophilum TaxID=33905 RepID=UPI0030A24088
MSDMTQASAQAPGSAPARPQQGRQEPASQPTRPSTPQSTPQPATPQHPRLLPLPARIRRAMSGSWAMLVATLILLVTAVIGLIPSFNSQALKQDIVLGAVPAGTDGHVWGTDALGRDVFMLTVAGARTAIAGPVAIAVGAMAIGLVFGLLAAYTGGWVDWLISRVVELMLSLPTLLLAIVLAGLIGGGYWVNVLVFTLLYAPYEIRLVRSAALAHLHDPFLDAARLLELSPAHILARHVFPVIRPVVGAAMFLDMSNALVSLSSLSFLGLGISPQAADWGRQLSDARDQLFNNPMTAIAPGIAIIVVSVAMNIVGDWITARADRGER